MATNDALIVFVLDQSSSMDHLERETCNGFNAFMEEQAAQPGDTYLTLVVFDTIASVRYTAGDAKLVDLLGTPSNPYSPSGGTALFDAVADAVAETSTWLSANATFDGKVVVVILSDGEENSSRRTDLDTVNKLIHTKKEDEGWEFVFMGSGGGSWQEGRKMAAAGAVALNYAGTAQSTNDAYRGVSSSLSQSRATGESMASAMYTNTSHLQADPTMQNRPAPDPTVKLSAKTAKKSKESEEAITSDTSA